MCRNLHHAASMSSATLASKHRPKAAAPWTNHSQRCQKHSWSAAEWAEWCLLLPFECTCTILLRGNKGETNLRIAHDFQDHSSKEKGIPIPSLLQMYKAAWTNYRSSNKESAQCTTLCENVSTHDGSLATGFDRLPELRWCWLPLEELIVSNPILQIASGQDRTETNCCTILHYCHCCQIWSNARRSYSIL